jgi:hypothetical protein
MNTLKHDIAELAAQQPILRNQRKTIHLVGERTIEPSTASWKHAGNREQLRLLYATQQVLKGVPLAEIETSNKPNKIPLTNPWMKKQIDKLVEKYGEVAHTD